MTAREDPRGLGVARRAMAMLLRPDRTWDAVLGEAGETRALLVRYAAPLAAIPAVFGVVGPLTFGFNIASVGVRMSAVGLILGAAASYVLTLAAVWLLALFVAATAPAFGGRRDRGRALQLCVYAATALWMAGLAEAYPSLSLPVGLLAGLYSAYSLYLGLPRLMGIPDERRLTAFAAILIAIALLAVARGQLSAKAAELGGPLSATYAPR